MPPLVNTCTNIRAAPCENVSSGICGQQWPRSACAFAQYDQRLRCLLTELLTIIECISWEQMPGSHFVHAWAESESVRFAHARRHLLAWRDPYDPGIRGHLIVCNTRYLYGWMAGWLACWIDRQSDKETDGKTDRLINRSLNNLLTLLLKRSPNQETKDSYIHKWQRSISACASHSLLFMVDALYRSVIYTEADIEFPDQTFPASILHKSTAGRYWPVRVADGPITARCRFM